MTNISKRLAAVIAAGTISVASAGFAAPALAQEAGVETPPAASKDADTIDPNANVSLTINKYVGDPINEGDPSGKLPTLEGAQFRVERLAVDLTTQGGWETLANTEPADLAKDKNFTAVTKPTNKDGTVTFGNADGLTVGAYRVTELNRDGYTTAPPFIVTLPHDTNGQWSYEQTVNPKNQRIIPSKQVDDTNATIGSTLDYTINAPVPAGELTRFNITDELVSALTLNAEGVEVNAQGANAPALSLGDDYTVNTGNNTLTVNFTDAGRAKLQDARKGDPTLKVTVGFNATINKIPDGGVISNTATIELPNGATVDTDGDNPDTTETENDPTSTTFGNLTITKTTSNGTDSLNDAQFELYRCEANGNGGYNLQGEALQMATTATGTPSTLITTAGSDAAEDGATDATANGYGIPLTSFAAETGTTPNKYCVLETQAPAGYVRNPEPQPVEVDATARTLTVSVDNQKNSVLGQLPATGAWGILLIFLVGLALLARGIYTSYKDSRSAA